MSEYEDVTYADLRDSPPLKDKADGSPGRRSQLAEVLF